MMSSTTQGREMLTRMCKGDLCSFIAKPFFSPRLRVVTTVATPSTTPNCRCVHNCELRVVVCSQPYPAAAWLLQGYFKHAERGGVKLRFSLHAEDIGSMQSDASEHSPLLTCTGSDCLMAVSLGGFPPLAPIRAWATR
eukprot:6199497-Pleurochrysis_carterae.AAC.2